MQFHLGSVSYIGQHSYLIRVRLAYCFISSLHSFVSVFWARGYKERHTLNFIQISDSTICTQLSFCKQSNMKLFHVRLKTHNFFYRLLALWRTALPEYSITMPAVNRLRSSHGAEIFYVDNPHLIDFINILYL